MRHADEAAELVFDALSERARGMVMVSFNIPITLARQYVNRLSAEWPGSMEVIEPESPDEWLHVVLCLERDLGGPMITSYTVTETRIKKDVEFWTALGRAFEH